MSSKCCQQMSTQSLPTRCRRKRAYANAHATYAVCMGAYATKSRIACWSVDDPKLTVWEYLQPDCVNPGGLRTHDFITLFWTCPGSWIVIYCDNLLLHGPIYSHQMSSINPGFLAPNGSRRSQVHTLITLSGRFVSQPADIRRSFWKTCLAFSFVSKVKMTGNMNVNIQH